MKWQHEVLQPFGLLIQVPAGTTWERIKADLNHELLQQHLVIIIRGLQAPTKAELPACGRHFGRLQGWSFGSINELHCKDDAVNYLYTEAAVPLHWDGAFAKAAPACLFFHCLRAPAIDSGGQTVFCDSRRAWQTASQQQHDRWHDLCLHYSTDTLAHYGGSFAAKLVQQHPLDGEVILRFAEPVSGLNPVEVRITDRSPDEAAPIMADISSHLRQPEHCLQHQWHDNDIVIADNLRLLHGREAFSNAAGPHGRHLRRVNALLTKPSWTRYLLDSLTIRRPEFWLPEIPIVLIGFLAAWPADGSASPWLVLATISLFFVCFHVGDIANCLADRDLDAVYKTRLSEAVYGLGLKQVRLQLFASIGLAMALGAGIALSTDRWWMIPGMVVGLTWACQYSLPPWQLKSKGIWQALTLWLTIFIGPLTMVACCINGMPALMTLLAFSAYGLMQTGLILINTAEDHPEDKQAGIRNLAVWLGPVNCVRIAYLAFFTGSLGHLLLLYPQETSPLSLLAISLAAVTCLGICIWLAVIINTMDENTPMPAIRRAAKLMPWWITATAWTSVFLWWQQ